MRFFCYSFFIGLVVLGATYTVKGQAGVGVRQPDASAMMEVLSTSKGLLIPRVTLLALTNVAPTTNPANSLLVYNTGGALASGYYYWLRDNVNNPIPGRWVSLLDTEKVESGVEVHAEAIKLGGALNRKTVIGTSGTNTLSISGLQNVSTADYTALNGVGSDRMVAVDATGLLKQLKASMPKFFYLPSILMPTAGDQITTTGTPHTTFNAATSTFTVNLYQYYLTQFEDASFASGATASSTGKVANPTRTTKLPVLSITELDYYITYYDKLVFENVTLNNAGVLTYKIKTGSDITIAAFMNVLVAVKP